MILRLVFNNSQYCTEYFYEQAIKKQKGNYIFLFTSDNYIPHDNANSNHCNNSISILRMGFIFNPGIYRPW